MLMKVLFFIYAAAIPLVPLWGAAYYGQNGESGKRRACLALFALQALLSAGSIVSYLTK